MVHESPIQPPRDDLIALVKSLAAENGVLKARLAELERQPGLDSSNSGKPRSSDGLKKSARVSSLREASKRKTGGQSSHGGETLRHTAEPDVTIDHFPQACSGCGQALKQDMAGDYAARQVFDLTSPGLSSSPGTAPAFTSVRAAGQDARRVSRRGERAAAIFFR